MVLTELRKIINLVSEYLPNRDALLYCQGYIAGVRLAPYHGELSEEDWRELNQYIKDQYKRVSYQSDIDILDLIH